ncbi:MAG TPA: sigma-70 family RNA polymerase sigma factor [Pirellulales bacterium]|jgi:RNA polymerase sigma factor (sigma-70 family)|nr:sigma-70 family RNA polymerase sigma factor [Pirellulales bacterium]
MRSVEEAVKLAQNGDVAAFADLIARFERTALAVAFGVLADSDRSGDTVQEAFVRAWQRLGDLREPERFGAWLCGIVRNLAHDAQRRASRESRARAAVAVPLYANRADDPALRLEDCENEERLTAALGKLDETTRMAVVLRYYEGMTSKQIGPLLDLPPAAIDMRLMRARRALRRELAGDEPENR